MKIAYDHSVFQFQKYGGISRYFYELIKILSTKKDIGINLFEGFHINEYEISRYKKKFESYWGYRWNYNIIPTKYMSHLFAFPNRFTFNNIYMHSKNCDIYHPTYYSKHLKSFDNSLIVLTVHDMIHELFPSQFRDSSFVISAKKKSIDAADAIICVSNNTKNDLMKIYDIPDYKISVVYHGNSLSKSVEYFNSIEIAKNYLINRPFILYVGDRHGYKNFMMLLDVYLTTFQDHFDLVCFGGGKFNQKELKIINEKNGYGKVFHLSGSDYLLGSLYKNAFCFVYPSLYEGFGIPLLEAMGSGCPVIASNTSSIPEVVGEAASLFNPYAKESLIREIESLISSDRKRMKLIKCGFEQEKKFGLEKTALETYNVYKNSHEMKHR